MARSFGQGFEQLEERSLLAASVTATLIGDTLVITGDASDNSIDVHGVGLDGSVEVSVAGAGQTLKVNGGTAADETDGTFAGVRHISIWSNGGNDEITVSDIHIGGNLTANGGWGTDAIELKAVHFDTYIGGAVVLNGGGGTDDRIEIALQAKSSSDLTVGAGMALSTWGGAGEMLIEADGYGTIAIGGGVLMNEFSGLGDYGSAEIRSGYGNVAISKSVVLNGGLGSDQLRMIADYGLAYGGDKTGISIGGCVLMSGGWGDDELSVAAYGFYGKVAHVEDNISIAGNVQMLGGIGNDVMQVSGVMANVSIHGTLNQLGGIGADAIENSSAGHERHVLIGGWLHAEGGWGDDWIDTYGLVVQSGAVILGGPGNDDIGFESNQMHGDVLLIGGAGNDNFHIRDNVIGGDLVICGGIGVNFVHLNGNQVSGDTYEIHVKH